MTVFSQRLFLYPFIIHYLLWNFIKIKKKRRCILSYIKWSYCVNTIKNREFSFSKLSSIYIFLWYGLIFAFDSLIPQAAFVVRVCLLDVLSHLNSYLRGGCLGELVFKYLFDVESNGLYFVCVYVLCLHAHSLFL